MAFLLNKSDMASSIGISVQAFDKWGVPPVERRGREVFYDVKTVLEIDRERRQQNQKSSGGENDLEERLLQARVNLTEEQAIAQRLKNQVAEHKVIDTAFSIFALSRLVQLSSATNSTSESLAATPKAVKAACENAEKRLQKDKNGADVPDKDTFTKNIGACRAFGGAVSTTTGDWTTAQFIGWLESQGAFNHPYWMCKGSWSYGNNKIITDTGCGNIHLAGAVIEVMGIKSAMTIRITTPTTSSGSGTANAQFTYINHGDGYSPGWRRDYNTKNKPPAFALGKTGETLADTDAVAWNLDSGAYCAQDGGASSLILHFNTGEGSCPAVQFRVNYRNGGIFYRSARDGYGFEADWERLFTTSGGTLDGAVGIGAQNTLGGHSLALGRGDTGLKQNGDGNLDVYAGNARVMRFTNGSIQVSKGLNVSGRVNPSDYSNFDIRYVRDIRLGTRVVQGMQKGVTYEKSGHVITGLCLVGDADGDNSAVYRPVQKYINGTWFNVSQV